MAADNFIFSILDKVIVVIHEDGSRLPAGSNFVYNIEALVQDCGTSSALAMELLQSCTKPSV